MRSVARPIQLLPDGIAWTVKLGDDPILLIPAGTSEADAMVQVGALRKAYAAGRQDQRAEVGALFQWMSTP